MIIYSDKFKASIEATGIALQNMVRFLEKGFRECSRMHRSRGKINSILIMQELIRDDDKAQVLVHHQETLEQACAVSAAERDERNDRNYLNLRGRSKKGGKKCY